MMMRTLWKLAAGWLSIVAVLTLPTGCGGEGGEAPQRYVLVSGGQAGVYYPTAGAIADLVSKHSDVRLDVQTSGGSVANARFVGRGDAHFAIMQNDIAAYARNGELMFDRAYPQITGVAALYPEHVQVVAAADAGIESITDLRGKRVAIGAIGSGSEANALQVLEAYGLSEADLGRVERLKASEARDYLQDGRIDAAFFTFGVGTAAIQELALMSEITFVPIMGDERSALIDRYGFYQQATIPAEAYEDLDVAVPTVAVMATLVAREDVPAEAVEQVLASVFGHIEQFRRAHDRLKQVNRERAHDGLTLPLHPGAEAFYASEAAGETADADAEPDADATE